MSEATSVESPASRRWRHLPLVAALAVAVAAGAGWWMLRNPGWWGMARLARAQIVARKYGLARSVLAAWLKRDPNSPEAHYLLARVELGEGRAQEAVNELARSMDLGHPPGELAPYHAIVQARMDQLAQAEPVLKKALADSPEPQPEVAEALAKLYLRTFRLKEAEGPLQRWMRDAPDDPRPYLLQNEVALRSGADSAVLIQNFKDALRRDPDLPEARLGLADRFRQARRWDEAAEAYAAYIRLKPDDPDAFVGAGLIAMEQGKIDDAAARFDRALELNPGELVALKYRAQIDGNRGRFAQARDRLVRAAAIDPFDPEVHFNLARAYQGLGDVKAGRREDAEAQKLRSEHSRMADLRSELLRRPKDVPLRLEIAQWLLDHGRDEEGLTFASQILRDAPGHEATVRMLVDYHTRKKDPGQANYYRLMLPKGP